MKKILLFIIFSVNFISATFATELNVQWKCRQEDHNIQQLASAAEVKIRLDEKGNINFSPDIFLRKGITIATGGKYQVDYALCINDFAASAAKSLADYQAANCTEAAALKICSFGSDELANQLKEKIRNYSFFANKEKFNFIPALFVGSDVIELSPDQAQAVINDFCQDQAVSRDELFSAAVIKQFEASGADYNCLFRYSLQASQQQRLIESQVCKLSDPRFCQKAKASAEPLAAVIRLQQLKPSNDSQVNTTFAGSASTASSESISTPVVVTNSASPLPISLISASEEAAGKTFGKLLKDGKANLTTGNFRHNLRSYNVYQMDNAIDSNVVNWMDGMDSAQRQQFLQNYLTAKGQQIAQDDQTLQQCSGSANTSAVCREAEGRRRLILNNVQKMYQAMHGSQGERLIEEIMQCKPEEPLLDLLKQLKDNEVVEKCKDLKPGEHKVFTRNTTTTKKGYETGDYLLKRKPDGTYQAVLNIEFEQRGGINVTPQAMRERARACMQRIAPYLKGPSGEMLEISLLNSQETQALPANQRPKQRTIKIEAPNTQTTSETYAETVDCPVITHELLHLMGLCDEYPETRDLKNPHTGELLRDIWSCRVATKAPSIMRNQKDVFEMALPRTLNCPCLGEPCKTIWNSNNQLAKNLSITKNVFDASEAKFRASFCTFKQLADIPLSQLPHPSKGVVVRSDQGAKFTIESRTLSTAYPEIYITSFECDCNSPFAEADVKEYGPDFCMRQKTKLLKEASEPTQKNSCPIITPISPSIVESHKQDGVQTASGKTTFENQTIRIVTVPTLPSLLQPNHFEKIMAGDCPTRAKGYQECAGFAYMSKSSEQCQVPTRCKDDQYFLGSQQ